ncbi:MAG: acylphosphatase [Rhodospirillales bacterium]|nr:acylphosphatase [Rhodospirillales bacterium]
MAGLKSVHVRISGRVQGVWFRGWTVEQARRLGLKGWVRNRADGTVEAVFQGSDAAVEAMLKLCREGPPSARVGGVTVEPSSLRDFDDFQQQPTA